MWIQTHNVKVNTLTDRQATDACTCTCDIISSTSVTEGFLFVFYVWLTLLKLPLLLGKYVYLLSCQELHRYIYLSYICKISYFFFVFSERLWLAYEYMSVCVCVCLCVHVKVCTRMRWRNTHYPCVIHRPWQANGKQHLKQDCVRYELFSLSLFFFPLTSLNEFDCSQGHRSMLTGAMMVRTVGKTNGIFSITLTTQLVHRFVSTGLEGHLNNRHDWFLCAFLLFM